MKAVSVRPADDLPAGEPVAGRHEVGVACARKADVGPFLEETDDFRWNHYKNLSPQRMPPGATQSTMSDRDRHQMVVGCEGRAVITLC
jgi:hypothetical protein